ncbi:unnamed protein product [Ceutorhynchus assimilis]|uniref:Uncharacterized protein n=1 Tax=Ceutorhynchus assimilis TaxID=467358 RepID=A0A9N9MLS5_9CUCU|nr:unnamed protein product [Ceutorhynchus assimilis]
MSLDQSVAEKVSTDSVKRSLTGSKLEQQSQEISYASRSSSVPVSLREQQSGEGIDEDAPEEPLLSYIQMLDAPRELGEPIDITIDYLKQISDELGLIKLCWPDLSNVTFEDRSNFPESYLKNSNKEKLLLLYAENFRRQFCYKYPDRKPLFLACDNECGMQVRTTI